MINYRVVLIPLTYYSRYIIIYSNISDITVIGFTMIDCVVTLIISFPCILMLCNFMRVPSKNNVTNYRKNYHIPYNYKHYYYIT